MSSNPSIEQALEIVEASCPPPENETSITVQGLSKSYLVYNHPGDRLKQFIFPRLQKLFGLRPKTYYQEFWALRDTSFEVKKGETVGIIGRNGAGKSTLLQIVCGTLSPSAGTVEVKGRVAALLELGSGFNPEFTGRENVYMNATILGLSKPEIDQKFESIIAFADIGDFIDQPVKTYSSGMSVRLAFAVIAHVDADILIVDEALAVGDAIFTQKCMRWLRSFQENGSVLFVSHDSSSIRSLCSRALWLHEGTCIQQGPAREVSEAYLNFTLDEIAGDEFKLDALPQKETSSEESSEEKASPVIDYAGKVETQDNISNARGWKTGKAEIISIALENRDEPEKAYFEGGENVSVRIRARTQEAMDAPILGFLVRDKLGQDLFGENTLPVTDITPLPAKEGDIFEAVFYFCLPMLPNGDYEIMSSVAEGTLMDHIQHHWMFDSILFKVVSAKVRFGLVGIPFNKVTMEMLDEE